MAKQIDWFYFRKSCQTCKKAKAFLTGAGVAEPKETVDGQKIKFDAKGAIALLADATRLVATKGTKIVDLNLKAEQPDDATLTSILIGPRGNMRAPTARVGKTMIVGFNDEMYREALGIE